MAQHSLRSLFLSLFAVGLFSLFAVCLGEPVKRTIVTVKADIATIATQVTKLDSAVDTLSASGILNLFNALADGPVDEDDGKAILSGIQDFVPNIQDILTKMSSANTVTALGQVPGITAIALSDIKTLNNSAIAFADALIAKAPADLVQAGMSVKIVVATAFASTIAVYSKLITSGSNML
ncbi:hydrophobic surface binding protein [Mycena pura]|uniref:Hydrophobic surface binding protein n=1 Tax=Mycena pura TaxID=153505 RepID=A0AAD6Y0W1_9AGAR|nr:hydrophobic surface binding protein [Mycena pura]